MGKSQILEYFFESYHYKKQTQLFKRLLYALVLVKCIYWLCFFDLLFGADSIIYIQPYASGTVRDLAYILINHAGSSINIAFIITALVISTSLIFIRPTYIAELILWLVVLNLHNRIYSTLSGGDHLLSQLLFFNIFLCLDSERSGGLHELRRLAHNLAVISILIQVCLVYFLSALTKLGDPAWINGEAVGIIAGIDHFSSPSRYSWPPGVTIFLNYFVLIYQLCFPLLALLNRTKLFFLLTGVIMHLYIAFVTGLPGFAAVMLLGYVYFWPVRTGV